MFRSPVRSRNNSLRGFYFYGVIIPLLLMVSQSFSKEKITWVDYKKAMQTSNTSHKLIFIFVHADWCNYCKVMEKESFRDSVIINKLNKQFIPITLNLESTKKISCEGFIMPTEKCLETRFKVISLPAIVLLSPSGKYLFTVGEYLNKSDLLEFLEDAWQNREELIENPPGRIRE